MAGIVGALAVQLVFAALFVWGLTVRNDPAAEGDPLEAVTTVDLPPPPQPRPAPDPAEAARGEPAPEGREGEALPVEAPPVAVVIDPAPAAPSAGEGSDPRAGAGTAGSGTGAGGAGTGEGGGDGGIATPARRIAGALRDSDYPRGAERQGLAGTVAIAFRVRTDGRVDRCRILRSSGHAVLDELTCDLFTRRYRFEPATNAAGQPLVSTLQTTFTWGTRRR